MLQLSQMFICRCFHISTGLMRPDFYWSVCPDVNCTVGLCFRMSTKLYVNMSSGLCFQMSILDCVYRCLFWTVFPDVYSGPCFQMSILDRVSRCLFWTVFPDVYSGLCVRKSILDCVSGCRMSTMVRGSG